jgi:hypothetical protein
MREGLKAAETYPEALLWVPYEDMCAAPSTWMARIAAFCELSPDPLFLSYAEEVLTPVASKPPFTLAPCLKEPFAETMRRLGYSETPS